MAAPTGLCDKLEFESHLTKYGVCGYNAYIIIKGKEKKSIRQATARESRLVEWDTEEPEEHTEKMECGDPELYALGMNPVSDKPIMYALTTCLHCKNTKKFLEENKFEVIVIHLDDYCDSDRSDLMEKVRKYNPRGTFPVVLMPNGKVIVGFRKMLLQEAMSK